MTVPRMMQAAQQVHRMTTYHFQPIGLFKLSNVRIPTRLPDCLLEEDELAWKQHTAKGRGRGARVMLGIRYEIMDVYNK